MLNSILKNLGEIEIQYKYGVPQIIWCYWEGATMSKNRVLSLKILEKNIGVPVVLLSRESFKKFLKPEHSLPRAFEKLSIVHRSDYIRAYLMHYYGGGWHDIKATECDFSPSWEEFENPNTWLIGRPESPNGAARVTDKLGRFMPDFYKELVAVPAWVARPNTPLTHEVLMGIEKYILDNAELLEKYPARHPREKFTPTTHVIAKYWNILKKVFEGRNPFYPIPWTLFGNFFHPAVLEFSQHISKNLPIDKVKNAGINHRG